MCTLLNRGRVASSSWSSCQCPGKGGISYIRHTTGKRFRYHRYLVRRLYPWVKVSRLSTAPYAPHCNVTRTEKMRNPRLGACGDTINENDHARDGGDRAGLSSTLLPTWQHAWQPNAKSYDRTGIQPITPATTLDTKDPIRVHSRYMYSPIPCYRRL